MFNLFIMVGGRWSWVMRATERKNVVKQITGEDFECVDNDADSAIYRTTDGLWKVEKVK